MGHVYAKIRLSNEEKSNSAEVDALVDTGAMLTVLPQKLADELGIKTVEEESVATGAGPITVKKGRALIKVNDREELFRVWISDIMDKVLLGVIVLEEFGLQVNPTTRKLVKAPMLMY